MTEWTETAQRSGLAERREAAALPAWCWWQPLRPLRRDWIASDGTSRTRRRLQALSARWRQEPATSKHLSKVLLRPRARQLGKKSRSLAGVFVRVARRGY